MQDGRETTFIATVSVSVIIGCVIGLVVAGLLGVLEPTPYQVDYNSEEYDALSYSDQSLLEGLIIEEQAIISVVERVLPAVASIIIEKQYTHPAFFPDGEEPELVEIGGGTGFFITEDGLMLTNKHVVSDEDAVYTVITNSGEEYVAEVVARDAFLDIALLQVDGEGFPTLAFGDSDLIDVGQTAIAIGNSLSEFQNSVTKGIISGIDRTILAGDGFGESELIQEAIQTDAAISEGNSGGPLINLFGQVIGVNTAVSNEGQSIGFAIPINEAKSIIDDVIEFGRIVRPWIGVRYQTITESVQEEYILPVSQGALIVPEEELYPGESSVIPGSPAAEAGIQPGDVILSVNDDLLTESFILSDAIHQYEPDDVVVLSILRNGEDIELLVTLAELDPNAF